MFRDWDVYDLMYDDIVIDLVKFGCSISGYAIYSLPAINVTHSIIHCTVIHCYWLTAAFLLDTVSTLPFLILNYIFQVCAHLKCFSWFLRNDKTIMYRLLRVLKVGLTTKCQMEKPLRVSGWSHSWMRRLHVLGIETSCDDTGAAIVNENGHVLGDCINSQTELTVE